MAVDKVSVLVQTFGGQVKTLNASTPADVAEQLGMGLNNTTINVNAKQVDANHSLRANDFVAFVTDKVTSGSCS
jgi:molybdopterin converting factor small subunit